VATASGAVQFKVDGVTLSSSTVDTTTLTNGSHTLTAVSGAVTSAPVQITVNNVILAAACGAPGVNGFLGCYYSGQNFNRFVFSRTDPAIWFDWSGTGPKGPVALGPDDYSVRWLGNFQFQAGTYEFTVNTDDGGSLYIDGQSTYVNWTIHGATPVAVNVPLTAGTHAIRLDYFQNAGGAIAQLTWKFLHP